MSKFRDYKLNVCMLLHTCCRGMHGVPMKTVPAAAQCLAALKHSAPMCAAVSNEAQLASVREAFANQEGGTKEHKPAVSRSAAGKKWCVSFVNFNIVRCAELYVTNLSTAKSAAHKTR